MLLAKEHMLKQAMCLIFSVNSLLNLKEKPMPALIKRYKGFGCYIHLMTLFEAEYFFRCLHFYSPALFPA